MTFSLRDLLALFFLLALALLAWRTSDEAKREKARLALLRDEIKSLEAQVRLDQPALHQAILHTLDEFQPFQAMRERSLAQFDVLRQKYSALEPRGANVLSLRGIPSLPGDAEPAPVIFRVWVPQERSVWLKFGVHEAQQSLHSSRTSDDNHDLLSHSPFAASGPFEMRLPQGDQTLEIATGFAHEGSLPLVITLNGTVVLRSSFVSAGVSGSSSGYISGTSQLDYGPSQAPPWLLTTHMNRREPKSETTHAFSLWLSDRSSDFANFPGNTQP